MSPLFKAKLRPYQEKGLNWLAFLHSLRFGMCLADDMGLGKTVQVLALLHLLKHRGEKRREPPGDSRISALKLGE